MANKQRKNRRDLKQLRLLFNYAKPYYGWWVLAGILVAVTVGLDLLRPYLLKYAISDIFPVKDLNALYRVGWLYLTTVFLSVGLLYALNFSLQYVGQNIIYRIRQNVFERILVQSESSLKRYKTGNLVTKVTNDTDAIRALFIEVLIPFCGDFLMMVGIIVILLQMHMRLALASLTVMILLGIAVYIFRQYSRRAYRKVRSCISVSNSFIQEAMSGIMIVKSYNAEKAVIKEYDTINQAYVTAGIQEVRTFSVFRPFVDFTYFICVVLILGYTNFAIDITDAALVFVFIQYIEKFFAPVRGMAERYNTLQSALAGVDRVGELWEQTSVTEIDDRPDFEEPFRSLGFENVWFHYGDEEKWVLKDVSFHVDNGELVGIAGTSGAGKTTVMSLALRMYIPQRGRILLNDKPIEDYSIASTRTLLGYVFQNQHLFKGTVAENISLHNPTLTPERIIHALQKVNLWDEIQQLPQGIYTQAGYLGSFFSAGERQLLSLARVMARRYPVLVLDEATANMDSATEERIQKSLAGIRGERTILLIAHRLSTIRNADRIYVFREGRIIQTGTYQELANTSGYFRELLES